VRRFQVEAIRIGETRPANGPQDDSGARMVTVFIGTGVDWTNASWGRFDKRGQNT
jgi:hypothetical protein